MTDTPKAIEPLAVVASGVTVGCKLPLGLLARLKNKDGEERQVLLKGSNASRVVGNHGITEYVDEDFMKEWLRRYKNHPAVKNGLVFIMPKSDDAKAVARERKDNTTGFEPLDPVKRGMLKNENGEDDKAALSKFRQQQADNPDLGRQIQE